MTTKDPILMLTRHRSDDVDQILGLELGQEWLCFSKPCKNKGVVSEELQSFITSQ